MSERPEFLFDKVSNHDLVWVEVFDSPAPQVLRAKVKRIYSSGKGIGVGCRLFRRIEFVRGPSTWGNMVLKVGEQALLFVRSISGQLYEDHWHGHMLVEKIHGKPYAIFQHKEMWFDEKIPAVLRNNSREDPKRSYTSAIRFDVMESYLLDLIKKSPR